jgi:hypothetical protein
MRYQEEPGNELNPVFESRRDHAKERMEGLFEGWGEAQALDMRYQAQPGNEGRGISCLNYHRKERNNGVKIKILILIYKLLVNPQKFAASVLHPHQATKARIFCF